MRCMDSWVIVVRVPAIMLLYCFVCSIHFFQQFQTESSGWHNGRDYEGEVSLKEYIGELYFKKYDSLDDSHFENFVERELTCFSRGDPEQIPKISLLDRFLFGEGSHRRISTTFSLELLVEFWSEIQVQSCEVIFVERLPHGVFADPFELKHLQHPGVFKEASVFGDTNLELPSFLSNRSLVEVHTDVDRSSLSSKLNFSLELQLHARYQPLDDSGYTNVEFRLPDVFLRYKMSDGANIRSCVSVFKDSDGIPRPKAIIWSLPSGIRAHEGVVSIITFSSALVSSLLIMFVAMRHSDT